MKSLKMLDVSPCQIDDAGVADLAKIKSLEFLGLPGKGITDVGLQSVSTLTKLKHINVPAEITENGLAYIGKLSELEELDVCGQNLTDASIEHVAKLTKLKELKLTDSPVTNKGFAKLGRLKSLEKLTLRDLPNVSIAGLKSLNDLKNLHTLYVNDIGQDDSVMDISGLVKLKSLGINWRRGSDEMITDADLACLGKLKNLSFIQINQPTLIGDEGFKHLAGLENMSVLIIGSTTLSDEGLSYLRGMKKLYSLALYSPKLTGYGLRHLEGLTGLGLLDIHNNNNISDDSLAQLEMKLPIIWKIEIRRDEKKW